jgi:hypothetical protein
VCGLISVIETQKHHTLCVLFANAENILIVMGSETEYGRIKKTGGPSNNSRRNKESC